MHLISISFDLFFTSSLFLWRIIKRYINTRKCNEYKSTPFIGAALFLVTLIVAIVTRWYQLKILRLTGAYTASDYGTVLYVSLFVYFGWGKKNTYAYFHTLYPIPCLRDVLTLFFLLFFPLFFFSRSLLSFKMNFSEGAKGNQS
jgi:hypothetical protein